MSSNRNLTQLYICGCTRVPIWVLNNSLTLILRGREYDCGPHILAMSVNYPFSLSLPPPKSGAYTMSPSDKTPRWLVNSYNLKVEVKLGGFLSHGDTIQQPSCHAWTFGNHQAPGDFCAWELLGLRGMKPSIWICRLFWFENKCHHDWIWLELWTKIQNRVDNWTIMTHREW